MYLGLLNSVDHLILVTGTVFIINSLHNFTSLSDECSRTLTKQLQTVRPFNITQLQVEGSFDLERMVVDIKLDT